MSQIVGQAQANAINIPSGGAETVVLTTAAFSIGDNNPVQVYGSLHVTPGAGVTGYTVRLRQGAGLAGTVIDTSELTTSAVADTLPYNFEDTTNWLNQVNGAQYTLSIACNGATAASSVDYADLTAEGQ